MKPKNLLLVLMTLAATMLPWGARAQNVSVWNGSAEIWTQGQSTQRVENVK